MRIDSLKDFSTDLGRVLISTVDGFCAFAWCGYFLFKSISDFLEKNTTGFWLNLILPIIILLMLVRLRIHQEKKMIIDIGSFVSVNFISILFYFKEV